jgi:hypothetical protein
MSRDAFDPFVAAFLADGPERGPEGGLERALAAVHTVGQRPAWQFAERWLPARLTRRELVAWRPGAALALLGLALLLLLALAIAAGTRPRQGRFQFGPAGDRLIAFQAGTTIETARIDGSGSRTLTAQVPFARSPVFSPSGALIAFVAPETAEALGGRLMVVPVDGSRAPADIGAPVDVAPAIVTSLAWSPDSRYVAFASDEARSRIYVAAVDGSGVTALTGTDASADLPTWSPDGTRIGFRVKEPDGIRTHLRSIRADGSDMQDIAMVIAADGLVSKLRWSTPEPSGTSAMSYWYSAGFGSPASAYIDLMFGHVNQPWSGQPGVFTDWGLPWSPDSLHMAILTRDEGVILADNDPTTPYDGQLNRLGHVLDCWVDWAPDGSGLYGASPGDCSHTVLVPLVDPTHIFTLPGSTTGLASWQPVEPKVTR